MTLVQRKHGGLPNFLIEAMAARLPIAAVGRPAV